METKDLNDAGMLVIKTKINAQPGDKPYVRGPIKLENGGVMNVVGFYAEKETKNGLMKYFYLKHDKQEEYKKKITPNMVPAETTNSPF